MQPMDRALEHGAEVLSLEELLSLIVDDESVAAELATEGIDRIILSRGCELEDRFGKPAAVKVLAACDLMCRVQEHYLNATFSRWQMEDLVELVRTRYSKFEREIYGAFFFDTYQRPLTHDLVFNQRIELWEHEVRQVLRHALAHGAKSFLVFCYSPELKSIKSQLKFPRDLDLAASQLDLEFEDYVLILGTGRWQSAKQCRELERPSKLGKL